MTATKVTDITARLQRLERQRDAEQALEEIYGEGDFHIISYMKFFREAHDEFLPSIRLFATHISNYADTVEYAQSKGRSLPSVDEYAERLYIVYTTRTAELAKTDTEYPLASNW